ncbi:uncharacterized protein NMK_2699 [Novimethylophilus kurashikiensis]|uniref:diguanylate cyclase n=2 Tax=Novimethylophilus kurashikiensis TaxID=1825523 RepID=A0A2R5FA54_9PROT|nr:uncharacterized protein NMK_2699 [Novimethylophilus kurashikiensis]
MYTWSRIKQLQFRSFPIRLSVALTLLAIGILAGQLILPPNTRTPFITVYPIIILTFYLCGNELGIFNSLASAFLAGFLFIEPIHTFPNKHFDYLILGFFALTCCMIGYLVSRLKLLNEKKQDLILRLMESESHYEALMKATPVGVFETDAKGYCLTVNSKWEEIAGISCIDALGDGWARALHPEDRLKVYQEWQVAALKNDDFTMEFRFQHPDGTVRWVIGLAVPLMDELGKAVGYVGTITDFTPQKAIEASLEYQAQTDALTGLNNRRHFMELAEREINRAKRYEESLTLFILDIDHFKKINDSFGHAAGDFVLKQLGQVCCNSLRSVDIAGRIGGEEFAVLLPETTLEEGKAVANHLREHFMNARMEYPGFDSSQPFTLSVGVASMSQRRTHLASLLAAADAALYEAKNQGRNRVCLAN